MCITELFSPQSLGSYKLILFAKLHGLLCRLFDATGKHLLLKDHLTTLSLNVFPRLRPLLHFLCTGGE
ncbi:hypothetical protein IEQ34_016164 [Dendrobium chrysotoxum]|uniref:Uncharacterized protein n=1 Tax=Dendrobium chrysotoxum TaxID=161865 RepID=A0AAV7GDD6_DENCH|nr:hypothetical protein IEQ34_016164 [Dendrobium chrysotoxum]